MDLAGMINNGVEALHRGSVDRESVPEVSTSSEKSQNSLPVWARIHKGKNNKIKDVKRWKLAETRPELSEMFTDREVPVDSGNEDAPVALLQESPFSALRLPPTSASEIGPGGNVSLTGLCASVAGMIPNDDQTQVLAGWIFEQIGKLDRSLTDNFEIEFKMGLISDESSGLRHRFPMLSEGVVDNAYWQQRRLRFKSEIEVSKFKTLESLMDSLVKANVANETNPINKENVLMNDSQYYVIYEPMGDKKTKIRVSKNDKEQVIECISKQRISDLYISVPNASYDLKMSLSVEHPIDFETIMPQIKGVAPLFERNKNRLMYKAQGCQVDLTSVHAHGPNGHPIVTKEAEIETNTELLGSVLHEYYESEDKRNSLDKFLEVIRYTMDSARFLVRNI